MDTKTLKDYGLTETSSIVFRTPVYQEPNSVGLYRPGQVLQAKDVTLHALSFENTWKVVKTKVTLPKIEKSIEPSTPKVEEVKPATKPITSKKRSRKREETLDLSLDKKDDN